MRAAPFQRTRHLMGASSYMGAHVAANHHADGGTVSVRVHRLFGREFETTGVLGCRNSERNLKRSVPSWLPIPGDIRLHGARLAFFSRGFFQTVSPSGYSLSAGMCVIDQGRMLSGIGTSVGDHFKFKTEGEAAKRYKRAAKIANMSVIFV